MKTTQTDQLAAAFCNRTLPKKQWTHGAHLRVGLWHLLRYPPDIAMDRLRDCIRQYNIACGVANTDTSGYHETITLYSDCADASDLTVKGQNVVTWRVKKLKIRANLRDLSTNIKTPN